MKQSKLLEKLNLFEKDLDALIELWKQFYNVIESSPSFSFLNTDNNKKLIQKLKSDIDKQANSLLKQMGGIEAYIDFFDNKYYKIKLVQNFRNFLSRVPEINPYNIDSYISKRGLDSSISLFKMFQTRIMPVIPQIKGKLELMSPDDNFILDSSSGTPFIYLKASNNKIDINKDDLIIQYLDNLHPIIIKSSKQLYLDGHYQNSIEEAIKAINQYIRDRTEIEGDGADLISKVFSEKNPVLSFSDFASATQTQKNEQVGFMEMLKGFIRGVRNVFAHSPATVIDPQIAFEYLVMASLFCKRIDQTKKVGISEP